MRFVFLFGFSAGWLGLLTELWSQCLVDDGVTSPAPLVRTAFDQNTREITLKWKDPFDDETNFTVEGSVDGGATWTLIGTTPANSASKTFTAAPAGTMQLFRVFAEKAGVFSRPSNVISVEGTDPAVADTDGDEMVDQFELTNGLDPYVNDAYGDLDGDRIPNIIEYVQGSDVADDESLPGAD
jgi:hypothetical protein